jgi:hypothetical protein
MWDSLFGKADPAPAAAPEDDGRLTHVLHVLLTSATRLRLGESFFAYAERKAAEAAEAAGDAKKWRLHVTEVCDETGDIPYVRAVTMSEENAKFDRYRVVSARLGGGADATLAYLVGARRNAFGNRMGADDVLHAVDDRAEHLTQLYALHESKGDPAFQACALTAFPST